MILLVNTITQFISIKIKPIGVTSDFQAQYNEDFNRKHPKFQNTKTLLLKDTVQIGRKKLVKLNIQFCGLMLLVT